MGFLHTASSCLCLDGGPQCFWSLYDNFYSSVIQKPFSWKVWRRRWATPHSGLQRAWLLFLQGSILASYTLAVDHPIPGFIIWLISPDSKHLLASWANSCSFCVNNKTRLNDANSGETTLDTPYWHSDSVLIAPRVCKENSSRPENNPKWPTINSSAGGCIHLNMLSPDCHSLMPFASEIYLPSLPWVQPCFSLRTWLLKIEINQTCCILNLCQSSLGKCFLHSQARGEREHSSPNRFCQTVSFAPDFWDKDPCICGSFGKSWYKFRHPGGCFSWW